jgi:uncharacterized membrane protein YhaH (DUF805 family)
MTDADGTPRYGERADLSLPERVEGRQAPGYGEYAPEGWVSPVPPVEIPTPDTAESAQDHRGTGVVRTDLRDQQTPRAFDAPPPTGAPIPGRPPASLRSASFNRFATLLLLAYGVYDVIRGALQTSSFVTTYVAEFKNLGYLHGTFEHGAALHTIAVVSAVASVALFLLVAMWAIRRLRAGRRAWLILLVAGLAVNLATGIAVVSVVMNDPSFVGMTSAPL